MLIKALGEVELFENLSLSLGLVLGLTSSLRSSARAAGGEAFKGRDTSARSDFEGAVFRTIRPRGSRGVAVALAGLPAQGPHQPRLSEVPVPSDRARGSLQDFGDLLLVQSAKIT